MEPWLFEVYTAPGLSEVLGHGKVRWHCVRAIMLSVTREGDVVMYILGLSVRLHTLSEAIPHLTGHMYWTLRYLAVKAQQRSVNKV